MKIEATVESTGGSNQKFDFDFKTGTFKLKKILPKGMVFPYDFGFIPGTIGADGDPLDVIIISEAPTFTGCSITCRLIGCLVAQQTERDGHQVRNDRYIAIPEVSEDFTTINQMSELPKKTLRDLESFFINYNALAGKKFEISKHIGAKEAIRNISKAKSSAQVANRVELLLPLTDTDGNHYPKKLYTDTKKELIKNFGGLTVYSRAPADGFWQNDKQVSQQSVLIYELLISELNMDYWRDLKERLQHQFNQQEIMIIHSPSSKIG